MLGSDEWHLLVGPHLSVRDLCHLMQVSRSWFALWVADRAWKYHRERVCRLCPGLEQFFDEHPSKDPNEHIAHQSIKSNENKKRKVAWIIPKCGNWWVFRRWLSRGCTMVGFRQIIKEPKAHIVMDAIVKCILPHRDYWERATTTMKGDENGWFRIEILSKQCPDGRRMVFRVAPVQQLIMGMMYYADTHVTQPIREKYLYELTNPSVGVKQYPPTQVTPGSLPVLLFAMWRLVLYEHYPAWAYGGKCRPLFLEFARGPHRHEEGIQ